MPLPKPQVPWETQLGSIGESAIKSRLTYFSIPTKYETDAGIDFYCELLENDSPSTPFYVQAKGTEHFDTYWGSGIPKSTILYWLQQQHPVFLIVYDDKSKTCFWMSIEDHRNILIEKLFKTNASTIYIRVDRSNTLEQDKHENASFIEKIKEDSISVQLFHGHPQFIGRKYVKRIPPAPRSGVELMRISENVRAGLYSLVQHYWVQNDIEKVYSYCSFLAQFDKSHYNHFVWLGSVCKFLCKKTEAKNAFEEAIRICKADKNWPKESMDKIIAEIEKEMLDL